MKSQFGVDARLSTDLVFAIHDETTTYVPKSRDVILNISGLIWNSGTSVNASKYQALI